VIDQDQKRFVWGVALACAPWIPTLIGLGMALGAISNAKATGLAAVAGGVAELLVWWGIATMIASQAIAIVWLCRSFSRDRWFRNFVSGFSILLSGLMLLLVSFFLWAVWFQSRHT